MYSLYTVVYTLLIDTVRPDPPAQANLTFLTKKIIRFNWTLPANPVIGGIRGYLLNFSPGCGTCSGSNLVSNTTFTALCIEWLANGQTCVFEIKTVTEDCGLESPPLRNISIIDGELFIAFCVLCYYAHVIPCRYTSYERQNLHTLQRGNGASYNSCGVECEQL